MAARRRTRDQAKEGMVYWKNEAEIVKAVIEALEAAGAWAVKIHGSMFQAGIPDVIACYRGRIIALEVKMPHRKKKATAIQRATIRAIRRAGGIAGVTADPDVVPRIIKKIDAELAEAA